MQCKDIMTSLDNFGQFHSIQPALQKKSVYRNENHLLNKFHSLKLTQTLKTGGWETTFLLGRPIFRDELLVQGAGDSSLKSIHFSVLSATYQFLMLSQVRNPILWSKDNRMGLISTITWSYVYLDLSRKKGSRDEKKGCNWFDWLGGAISGLKLKNKKNNKLIIGLPCFSQKKYDVHMNCFNINSYWTTCNHVGRLCTSERIICPSGAKGDRLTTLFLQAL